MTEIQYELGKNLKRMHEIKDVIEPEKVNKEKTALFSFIESMHLEKVEAARNQTLAYLKI